MSTNGRSLRFKPEFVEQIRKLYQLGATDAEVADILGVNRTTLWRWQTDNPKLTAAIKTGKDAADERVISALYHKAVGYTFKSEKIFQYEGEVVRAECTEHVPPDTVACIWWLKNRRPDEWRDRQQIDLTNSDGSMAESMAAARARVTDRGWLDVTPALPTPKPKAKPN